MEKMIGKDFSSLERRVIYAYAATIPAFMADEAAPASIESQRQMYGMLEALAWRLYESPEIIGLGESEDGYLADFALNKSNPPLMKRVNKIDTKIRQLYGRMTQIGILGELSNGELRVSRDELKYTKNTLKMLADLGIVAAARDNATFFRSEAYPEAAAAWKYLAKRAEKAKYPYQRTIIFSNALFCVDRLEYAESVFQRLLEGNNEYQALVDYLMGNGYHRDWETDNPHRLDLVKNNGNSEAKLCSPGAAKHYWGVSLSFDRRFKNQITLTCRLPKYRELLLRFDSLSSTMQEIIVQRTKPCNACGYCTQTDKTGKREPLAVRVKRKNSFLLCPLYPTWGYQSAGLGAGTAERVRILLEGVEPVYQEIGL